MQQLPLTVQTDSRKFVEDLYDFLGTLVRDWRLIAACVGITLTLAVIYLARVKPVYLASARLLVLQHGGQPLTVANGASNHENLFQSMDGSSNSLATQVMIIRSPLIVGRSLAAAGLKDVSAGSVIEGLSVKLPDPAARAIDRLILGILGKGSVELVVRSHLGIPHGAAVWRRLLREVCLPFLRPYPILAAVMDGDIPSRPSSL